MIKRIAMLVLLLSVSLLFTQTFAGTNFLVLTDIHFDPFTVCYDNKQLPCPMIKKLQAAQANEWPAILSTYDTKAPIYHEDTNYPLLVSSLAAAKRTATAQQVQFVLVLGDFVGHDFHKYYRKYAQDNSRAGYQAFVKKLFIFLTHEIGNAFPSRDVYALVGNNDTYRSDYYSNPHGQFYEDTGKLWSQLIKNKVNQVQMRSEFPIGGYYAVDATNQGNMRLIMLNTVLFSDKAKGNNLEQATHEEFEWLHNELVQAKEKHQKVIISMHIPEGIDVYSTLATHLFKLIEFWRPDCSERFESELEQFAPEISAILAGHLHMDWFQTLRFNNLVEVPVIGTPAISPLFGNNPGFKIYTYSNQTGHLENFVTYYYPLNPPSKWSAEYNFSQTYKPGCQACPISEGVNAIQRINDLAALYKRLYAVNTDAQPITIHWDPYYWCALHETKKTDYKKCIS